MGVPCLTLYALFNSKCRFRFWCELEHDLTATNCDAILVKRVESLLAFFADVHQIGIAQDGEMVRNGGLREADLFDDFIDG